LPLARQGLYVFKQYYFVLSWSCVVTQFARPSNSSWGCTAQVKKAASVREHAVFCYQFLIHFYSLSDDFITAAFNKRQ
jgi:hypothetical protein